MPDYGYSALAPAIGAQEGLATLLKQRLMERAQKLAELTQQQTAAHNAEQLQVVRDANAETRADRDERLRYDRGRDTMMDQLRADASTDRNNTLRANAIQENYAPGDTITNPADQRDAARLMPGLVRLRPAEAGTAPLEDAPWVADYQGTSTQRRQLDTDKRAEAAAGLADKRYDLTERRTNDLIANRGVLTAGARFQAERSLRKDWNALSQNWRTMKNQVDLMETGVKAAERGDMAAGAQAILVTFQKILDPTSVVRESEYARSASGMSALNMVKGFVDRVQRGGVGVTLPELKKFHQLGLEMVKSAASQLPYIKKQYEDTAIEYGLDPARVIAEDPLAPGMDTGGGVDERVRVVGPNGETGTIKKGDILPPGWKIGG
jgi:hypothetical protein